MKASVGASASLTSSGFASGSAPGSGVATEESDLTLEERRAVTDYVSPAAYVLNDNLRNGYPLTEQQQTIVDNLDKALDKFPLYTDAEPLNRSLLFMYQEDAEKFVSDALEKGYIQEKSYASSTQHGVYNSEDNVRMVIRRVTLEDNLTAFLLIQKMKYFLRETPSLLLLMHT